MPLPSHGFKALAALSRLGACLAKRKRRRCYAGIGELSCLACAVAAVTVAARIGRNCARRIGASLRAAEQPIEEVRAAATIAIPAIRTAIHADRHANRF